jgi:hypothetical protein
MWWNNAGSYVQGGSHQSGWSWEGAHKGGKWKGGSGGDWNDGSDAKWTDDDLHNADGESWDLVGDSWDPAAYSGTDGSTGMLLIMGF